MESRFPVGKGKAKVTERLEVEDEEERQQRIQEALETLNSSSPHSKAPNTHVFNFDFGDRSTYEVPPPTELLSRVQAFLPQLEASNAILAQRVHADPKSVDIESIAEDQEQYIEMNLGLGVFEDRNPKLPKSPNSGSSSDESDSSTDSVNSSSDELIGSEADSTSSESDEWLDTGKRPIKPLPKRAGRPPEILVLDERPSRHFTPPPP